MFVIGALPAFLALVLRSLLPESPRWLAVRGRAAEADAAMTLIENETQKATGQPLPPPQPVVSTLDKPPSWADLFGPGLPAPNAGRVGDLVCGVFRELWALDLDADPVPHRVQAAARRIAALRADHAGGRAARHADLRARHRPCRAARVVRPGVRRRDDRADVACLVFNADRRAGADLRHHCVFLRQLDQYRRLSLYAGTLPDTHACDCASERPPPGCGSRPSSGRASWA